MKVEVYIKHLYTPKYDGYLEVKLICGEVVSWTSDFPPKITFLLERTTDKQTDLGIWQAFSHI